MFSWFKKKKAEKKQVNKPTPQAEQEDQWIYEYVLQYLACPVWKAPIQQFIDQNCGEFDDTEENKFEYTEIHNRFKALVDGQLERLLEEVGVSGEQLMAVVQKGLKHKKHARFFEQIIIIDNFVAIKGLMLKRNKQLELEAAKQLQEEEKKKETDPQMKRLELEKDQAEVEHAIMVSLEMEKQKKIMEEEEEKMIRDAIESSMATYQKEKEKLLEGQTEEKEAKKGEEKEAKKEEESLPGEPYEDSQQHQDYMKVAKRMGKDLPSLKRKGTLEPLSMDQMLEHRNQLKAQLDSLKTQEQTEIKEVKEEMEERKKRLQAQRQMILQKKEKERNQEVIEYKQTKEEGPKEVFRPSDLSGLPGLEQKDKGISSEEMKRRQDIMNKIKINL